MQLRSPAERPGFFRSRIAKRKARCSCTGPFLRTFLRRPMLDRSGHGSPAARSSGQTPMRPQRPESDRARPYGVEAISVRAPLGTRTYRCRMGRDGTKQHPSTIFHDVSAKRQAYSPERRAGRSTRRDSRTNPFTRVSLGDQSVRRTRAGRWPRATCRTDRPDANGVRGPNDNCRRNR